MQLCIGRTPPLIGILLIALTTLIPHYANADEADSNSLDPVEHTLEDVKSACEQSDSTEYLVCIEDYNEKLKKRETITASDLEVCAATRKSCLQTCKNNIKRNILCDVAKCPICPTIQLVDGRKKIIVEGESQAYKYETPILAGQNITTIIKLTNHINNTNIVDIPTNINSTNVNNIYIYNNETSETGGDYGMGYTKQGSCCVGVQPKTCKTTSVGVRCRHKRHKTCGPQCTSKVIHVQNRQRCTRETGCQMKTAYVPEPQKTRCVYTSQWPHVSCGASHKKTCDGCYDHYGYGAEKYYSGGRYPRHCTGCYDDAFDMGPLYRRGPVFQPFYYHQPPCHLTGTCGMPMCNYYGCYGNQFIDPAFGYPAYANPSNGYDYGDDYEEEEIEIPTGTQTNGRNSTNVQEVETSASWGVQVYKCKVVGDDGSIEIRNCTGNELEGNPFASSPSDYPYYPPQPNESPDYMLDPVYYEYAKRSAGNRNFYGYPFVHDDDVDEVASKRPRRRVLHSTRRNAHRRRRVQIVPDEDENNDE